MYLTRQRSRGGGCIKGWYHLSVNIIYYNNIRIGVKTGSRKPSERGGGVAARFVNGWDGGERWRRGCSWATVFTHHTALALALSVARVFGFDNNRYRAGCAAAGAGAGRACWGTAPVGWAGRGGRACVCCTCTKPCARAFFADPTNGRRPNERTNERTSGAGRRQRRRLRLLRYKVTVYTYIPRRRQRRRRLRHTRAPAAAKSWTPVCFQRWTGTRSRNRSKTCATSPQWTDGRYPGAYRREYHTPTIHYNIIIFSIQFTRCVDIVVIL